MKRRFRALPMLFVLCIAACGGGEKTQAYRTDDDLSLEVPPGVVASSPGSTVPGQAVLRGAGMELTYNYSAGAGQPAPGHGDVRVSLLYIDGHNAYSEYFRDADDTTGFPYVATLYIADAGGGKSLTMVIRSADEDGLDQAKKIFRSVQFHGSGPQPQAAAASTNES